MVDTLSPQQRSRQMARVRSQDTAPEVAVRCELHARGLRFRLHRSDLPGRPDIVLPKHRLVIYVHGCFWHGCQRCDRGRRRPSSNRLFWNKKLDENRNRDLRNVEALQALGWETEVIWECDTRDPDRLTGVLDKLSENLQTQRNHESELRPIVRSGQMVQGLIDCTP